MQLTMIQRSLSIEYCMDAVKGFYFTPTAASENIDQ